jgi:pimeloyl-ACP methyl ester carboxylesterase
MRKPITLLLAVVALAAGLLTVTTPAQADGTDPSWASCAQYSVPVTLPGDATSYHISGRLCTRVDALRGSKTVQLLVPGWSYDHNYFNPSYQPNTYSWVYAETSKGYTTFNIDRLGTGASSKPPAAELTLQNQAAAIGQVVQALRNGTVGTVHYQLVVGVGHSFGAAILQYLAGTATNATTKPNYLVLEDFLTTGYAPGVTALANALYPASSDPAFVSAGLPTGYLTTRPGTRGGIFYYSAGADPAMITLDESLKQTGTDSERTTLPAARASTVTHGVSVPTVIAVGQYDSLDCNEASGLTCASSAAVQTREAGNFSPRACLSAYVLTNAGHDTNLHITARNIYNYVDGWLDNYTINYVNQLTTNGCLPF